VGTSATPDFRHIPSVDVLLREPVLAPLIRAHGRAVVLDAVRTVLARLREAAGAGAPPAADVLAQVSEEVALRARSTLRRVINATGVVVHTNLGRAPLSGAAREAMDRAAAHYGTLEYDLDAGGRGSRASRLERQLAMLFPGCAALAVNNNAAAVYLALRTLAAGREVVISRGELVEIGGSFRVPDMMAESGARLKEVGTTNRTRASDYEKALGPATALLLKVHPSNYRVVGFTQEATVEDLAALARGRGLPLMVDQGSGYLRAPAGSAVRDEPTVGHFLAAGADLVTFSGDKLLGGPQAGIAVGRSDLIERLRRSPMYRVLRLDKATVAGLEATLEAWARGTEAEDLPVLRMITASPDSLASRASSLARRLAARLGSSARVDTMAGASRAGGGSAPGEDLPTTLVRLVWAGADAPGVPAWEAALRAAPVPVIARVHEDALWLDPRTIDPAEEDELIEMVARARAGITDPSGCA
jgi:L-seryl-tRNA(Ser) seleniumtransferase